MLPNLSRVHETYGPAPLFTNIRGYGGDRVVGAPLAYSSLPKAKMARVAIALGLEDLPANPIQPMFAAANLSFDGGRTPLGPIDILNCLLDPKETGLHIASFDSNYPKEIKERVLARWKD